MNDYQDVEVVEGWQLELGDAVVFTGAYEEDDEMHHIVIEDLYDDTQIRGEGYCHDHDMTCTFIFGSFETVTLWSFNQD